MDQKKMPAGRPALPGKGLSLGFLLFAALLIMAAELPVTELGVYNGADRTKKTTLTQDGTKLVVDTGMAVNGTTLVVDAANNRVGIGTATPKTRLHVSSSTNVNAATLGTPTGDFAVGGSWGYEVGRASSGKTWMQVHRFDGTATAYDMVLQPSGGNVGIGTSTVPDKLTVAGNINASAATYVVLPGGKKDYGMMATAPSSPAAGDRYVSLANYVQYIYNGSAWVNTATRVVGNTTGATGSGLQLTATSEIPCTTMNVNIYSNSDITLDGSTNDAARQVIDIGGAVDGQILTVINTGTAGFSITIPCFGGGALYSKVIAKGGAASIVLGCGPTGRNDGATFRYVGALSMWVQIG